MKDVPTGLIFSPIPKDYVKAIWPSVAKVLKKSVFTAKGKYEVDDVLDCILKDELVLWVVIDTADDEVVAAITTRLIEYPQGNAMAMDWIGGSRMREWLPIAMKTLSKFSKENGCSHLEGYGRKAWSRWLQPYGWEPEYIAYRMELKDG